MNCVNIKSKEFEALLEATKLPSLLLEMRIAKWQEKNGLDRFPTSDEVLVRSEVVELFESDPELANSVYEALGFSPIQSVIINSKDTLDLSNKLLELTEDKFLKESFEKLIPYIKNNPNIKFVGLRTIGAGEALYTGEFTVLPNEHENLQDFIKTYIHELYHVITLNELSNNEEFNSNITNLREEAIEKLGLSKEEFKKLKNIDFGTSAPSLYYGLLNNQEFISELFSNKQFSDKLDTIKIEKNKTLLDKVFDFINKLFNKTNTSEKLRNFILNNIKNKIEFDRSDVNMQVSKNMQEAARISDFAFIPNIKQKQQAIQLYSQYLEQNPNGSVEGFKEFINNRNNETQYQLPQGREIEEFVASEKTIRDLAARMSDRIGIPVRFESDRAKEYKGKLENGAAVINLAYTTLDTPIHEILGHPIIRAIKNNIEEIFEVGYYETGDFIKSFKTSKEAKNFIDNHPNKDSLNFIKKENKSQLYQNLLKELEYGKGKEVFDRIKRDYIYKEGQSKIHIVTEQDHQNGKYLEAEVGEQIGIANKYTLEEQQEEALVELLGLYTAGKLNRVKDGKLISLLKRLLKEMKAFMKQLLGQKEVEVDKLPDNMSLGDIADLLAYSNSKLILPGNEVVYTTPDNQQFKTYVEASKHISDLAKSVEDVDLSNVGLNTDNQKAQNINYNKEYSVSQLAVAIVSGQSYLANKIPNFEDENGYEQFLNGVPNGFYYPSHDETEIGLRYVVGFIKDNNKWYSYINEDITKSNNNLKGFIEKNKEYEQSKEIIEEWKKVNNIQYNPEEVYSRGQGFYSIAGAFADFDVNLMFQNLLAHIEDNKKAGGQFTISATTDIPDHSKSTNSLVTKNYGKNIYYKIFPKSEDILWATPQDCGSGSVIDAAEKIGSKLGKELTGVSYTKYPNLRNINEVQSSLTETVEKTNEDRNFFNYNELGINLTHNNFRLEYDEDIPYSTKKIIDSINSILDQKYGKLVEPEIGKKYKPTEKELSDYIEVASYISKVTEQEKENYRVLRPIQPTQTNETLKESIESVKSRVYLDDFNYDSKMRKYKQAQQGIIPEYYSAYPEINGKKIHVFALNTPTISNEVGMWQKEEDYDLVKDYIVGETENVHGVKFWVLSDKFKKEALQSFKKPVKPKNKEYTDQALINTKIAALKEVVKKHPRSLIRSEVRPISNSNIGENLHIDLSFFQKSPSEQEEYLTNMLENLQEEEEVTESVEVEDVIDSIFQGSLSDVINNMIYHMDLSDSMSEILLKILSKTNAEIEYVNASELTSTDTIMEYDHGRNVIKVSRERLNEYSPAEILITLLHEMVHSVTVESLRNPKTFEQKDLVDLIESFIKDNKDLSDEYGMSSIFEFVAELYSNPEFRDKVKEASKTKWWSEFINAIRRLLGLSYKKNYNNLIEKVIDFVDNAESSETTFDQIFERKSTEKESKYANLTSHLNIIYEEIQDKIGQIADRIRASQKFKNQEDKKEYLENIEKLIEFLEEHHETGQWVGVLEYTKLFLKTTQQVNNLLEKITPQDIEDGDLGALLHRYEEYLAAYDLLEDMKELLDFADRKSDELSEKELEDVKEIRDFLSSARIVKEGIDSKILHIKKRQLVKFYSNPLYNTQVTTNWRMLLSKEYQDLPKEEREKISEAEYISQKLNGEYKQDYEADLKKSAEKLVYDPLIDISWTARHLYDPFNTNQPIIQILTNFIGEIRQRIIESSRAKNFTIDELHEKLIKEKGNKKPSALFKNLYQQDKNGNYFLKGEYDITFYDAYQEEYLPILQSIQEIYKLFGSKFSEETRKELNKLRMKQSTWEKKYLKEDRLTPKDKFKTDLSTLSPTERQMLEEFIDITKGSHNKTEGRVSLIRNASFKRGVKRNEIEFFKFPAINKTDIERRIEVDAKGIIKDKTEDLFTIRTDDVGYAKEAITAKGRPVAEIPIYFRGNVDPSQQSLDLTSMYKMEFWNGEQFKESTQGKYTAHMILDVVGSNDFLKKSRGVPRLLQNAFAKRQPNQKVEGTSTNTYHRIQGIIERNFGGITTYYAGRFLGKDVNKMISNIQAMTGVLGMSFNAAAGVANLFNGFSNLIMEGVGNNIVGRKHLLKAEGKYMLALANGEILSDLTNPVKKSFINQLNEYFDVFGGLMPEQQSSLRNNFMRKFASLGMLNWMNDSGEHMLHSILNMAILDSIKVMNKDGKYINKQGEVVSEENAASLLDMFYLDKNGHLAVNEAVGKTKYNLTIDFQNGGKVHIKNLIKKKIFDLYGVYDTNFKNELSKLWGGKLLMTFKNFFLSQFDYRFAGIEYSHLPLEEREDWQRFYSTADQEYIEGIYTTFVYTVVIPIFKGFKFKLIKENYNKLTDYQKANLKKALFEFAMTSVILPAIGLLLAAMDGDDDDKLWFAIYINRRLIAELAQFRNPVEATKLLTNPIASAKFVRDAISLSLEIIRPWRWDERAGDGELRMRKRIKRVVPIWNQLEKNYRQLYNIQFNN